MGANRQTTARQINRFIPDFSFEITRFLKNTTDGWEVQAAIRLADVNLQFLTKLSHFNSNLKSFSRSQVS